MTNGNLPKFAWIELFKHRFVLPGLTPFRSLLCECLGIGMFFFFAFLLSQVNKMKGLGSFMEMSSRVVIRMSM